VTAAAAAAAAAAAIRFVHHQEPFEASELLRRLLEAGVVFLKLALQGVEGEGGREGRKGGG